jgi:hypothetical protein
MWEGYEKGRCPLCSEDEDPINIHINKMFENEEVEGTVFE